MNFWERITGSDMTRQWRGFETRVARLPSDYGKAWKGIKQRLMIYSEGDMSGRRLTSILDGVVGLFEDCAADGESIEEAVGGDLNVFCAEVAGAEGARNYRDKWRDQLNRNVARKLCHAQEAKHES